MNQEKANNHYHHKSTQLSKKEKLPHKHQTSSILGGTNKNPYYSTHSQSHTHGSGQHFKTHNRSSLIDSFKRGLIGV